MVGEFCKGGMNIIVVIVLTDGSVGAMIAGFYDIWDELGGVKLKGGNVSDIIMILELVGVLKMIVKIDT